MATQTKTERQTAAQKAAATRNTNKAVDSFSDARNSVNTAFGHVGKAAGSFRDAAVFAAKSVASRAQAVLPGA